MSDSQQGGDAVSRPGGWAKAGHVTLRCRADGPLVVELPDASDGHCPGFRVIDHLGAEFPLPEGKRSVALCRCGKSAKKPFCDGSHRSAGFQAENLAGEGRC